MVHLLSPLHHGHRFPAAIISCAVRWYFRFQLCLRDREAWRFEPARYLAESPPGGPGAGVSPLTRASLQGRMIPPSRVATRFTS
jgi:hypothetical protein